MSVPQWPHVPGTHRAHQYDAEFIVSLYLLSNYFSRCQHFINRVSATAKIVLLHFSFYPLLCSRKIGKPINLKKMKQKITVLMMMLSASVSVSAKVVETTLWEDTYTNGVELNSETVAALEAGNVLRV